MKYSIFTLIFISCSIQGMELKPQQNVGLSALLEIDTSDTKLLQPQKNSTVPQLTTLITERQKSILYDIQNADITTVKLNAVKDVARAEIFDALCAAIIHSEKSPVPARIVRRGMMIFGTEGYHTAFVRSLEEKNIALLKGLCSDSYSHMVQLAWRQDSDDYRDAFTTLENNRAWISKNDLQSVVAQLFDSKTLHVRAQVINCAARFSFWRKQLPIPATNPAHGTEENIEQATHSEEDAPDSPYFQNIEDADGYEEFPEKKTPLLMWLDRQIERASRHWKVLAACCAGAWFSWHYSARK